MKTIITCSRGCDVEELHVTRTQTVRNLDTVMIMYTGI